MYRPNNLSFYPFIPFKLYTSPRPTRPIPIHPTYSTTVLYPSVMAFNHLKVVYSSATNREPMQVAKNKSTSKSHLSRQAPEFPNRCRKSLPRDSSRQCPLVVTSSGCFAQVRPSSFPYTTCSQFIPSFPGNPFHKQCPPFVCGYERKGLGNSGCMIALPWSQQLVISASSLCTSTLYSPSTLVGCNPAASAVQLIEPQWLLMEGGVTMWIHHRKSLRPLPYAYS